MDGGATFYIAMAAMAAGAVVTTMDTVEANKRRQQILEEELRANELLALDEENQRLIALREANDDILVGAGGIEAFASPSLIAARSFNFKMGMTDIQNIRYNTAQERSAISTKISILQRNSRATITAGIFEVAGIAASAYGGYTKLKGPSVPKAGTGGANATKGVGHLDLPGSTGMLS